MILLTPRLMLRPARPDDLAGLHAVMSDPRAMRYWSRPEHESLAETQEYLDSMLNAPPDSEDFIVERDGRVIGKAGAWRLPEVGYILHPDQWRQGLAEEAMRAVLPHLFARHQPDALTAEIDPRNTGSWRLLEKLGFRETHRAARTMLWRDEWCDSVYFACPRPLAT